VERFATVAGRLLRASRGAGLGRRASISTVGCVGRYDEPSAGFLEALTVSGIGNGGLGSSGGLARFLGFRPGSEAVALAFAVVAAGLLRF
jgi:hypothetical protein